MKSTVPVRKDYLRKLAKRFAKENLEIQLEDATLDKFLALFQKDLLLLFAYDMHMYLNRGETEDLVDPI